jgi:predicted transcriptional regulator
MNTQAIAMGTDMRDRRERLYLSQRELAALADCSLPMIAHFERGVFPRAGTSPVLERVLAALDELESGQPGEEVCG